MQTKGSDKDRVLKAATAASGGDATKAERWYLQEQLDTFDRKTPATLVSEGRAEDVLKYIESLEAGPTG
jgi:uncharacterized protein (DUF2384 family)